MQNRNKLLRWKIKEEDENDPLYGINTFEELKDSIMEGFRRELDKRGGDE